MEYFSREKLEESGILDGEKEQSRIPITTDEIYEITRRLDMIDSQSEFTFSS